MSHYIVSRRISRGEMSGKHLLQKPLTLEGVEASFWKSFYELRKKLFRPSFKIVTLKLINSARLRFRSFMYVITCA